MEEYRTAYVYIRGTFAGALKKLIQDIHLLMTTIILKVNILPQ